VILESIAGFARKLQRLPTHTELRMQRRLDPHFPVHSTISNHFRSKADLAVALLDLSATNPEWADLAEFVESPGLPQTPAAKPRSEGSVYLLKSGQFYKIGRSDDIERRFREVKIALPEQVTLVH